MARVYVLCGGDDDVAGKGGVRGASYLLQTPLVLSART
jgi:hypothetical protein